MQNQILGNFFDGDMLQQVIAKPTQGTSHEISSHNVQMFFVFSSLWDKGGRRRAKYANTSKFNTRMKCCGVFWWRHATTGCMNANTHRMSQYHTANCTCSMFSFLCKIKEIGEEQHMNTLVNSMQNWMLYIVLMKTCWNRSYLCQHLPGAMKLPAAASCTCTIFTFSTRYKGWGRRRTTHHETTTEFSAKPHAVNSSIETYRNRLYQCQHLPGAKKNQAASCTCSMLSFLCKIQDKIGEEQHMNTLVNSMQNWML